MILYLLFASFFPISEAVFSHRLLAQKGRRPASGPSVTRPRSVTPPSRPRRANVPNAARGSLPQPAAQPAPPPPFHSIPPEPPLLPLSRQNLRVSPSSSSSLTPPMFGEGERRRTTPPQYVGRERRGGEGGGSGRGERPSFGFPSSPSPRAAAQRPNLSRSGSEAFLPVDDQMIRLKRKMEMSTEKFCTFFEEDGSLHPDFAELVLQEMSRREADGEQLSKEVLPPTLTLAYPSSSSLASAPPSSSSIPPTSSSPPIRPAFLAEEEAARLPLSSRLIRSVRRIPKVSLSAFVTIVLMSIALTGVQPPEAEYVHVSLAERCGCFEEAGGGEEDLEWQFKKRIGKLLNPCVAADHKGESAFSSTHGGFEIACSDYNHDGEFEVMLETLPASCSACVRSLDIQGVEFYDEQRRAHLLPWGRRTVRRVVRTLQERIPEKGVNFWIKGIPIALGSACLVSNFVNELSAEQRAGVRGLLEGLLVRLPMAGSAGQTLAELVRGILTYYFST